MDASTTPNSLPGFSAAATRNSFVLLMNERSFSSRLVSSTSPGFCRDAVQDVAVADVAPAFHADLAEPAFHEADLHDAALPTFCGGR